MSTKRQRQIRLRPRDVRRLVRQRDLRKGPPAEDPRRAASKDILNTIAFLLRACSRASFFPFESLRPKSHFGCLLFRTKKTCKKHNKPFSLSRRHVVRVRLVCCRPEARRRRGPRLDVFAVFFLVFFFFVFFSSQRIAAHAPPSSKAFWKRMASNRRTDFADSCEEKRRTTETTRRRTFGRRGSSWSNTDATGAPCPASRKRFSKTYDWPNKD